MTPQQIIGRYEVLEELGHGAMGTVYRAKDPAMDRIVALKTVRPEILSGQQGSEFRERFYREARAAGAMAHPGIVPVFDVGEHQGMPFLVMEFIKGRTLADAAKSGERLPLERVCEIGQQVAEALGYAHQKGVVHRDIKAANILLTSRESYGIERPKITDFGVAKLISTQITTTGQMLGTPSFMPPEQFSGGAIDGRTDIFALGVILYWLVTGDYPFPGETLMTVSYKVMHTEPVPPGKLNPAVPEMLNRLILKCLAKNPADRYQTGEELAREMAALRAAGMQTGSTARLAAATIAAGLPNADPKATLDSRSSWASSGPQIDREPAQSAASAKKNTNLTMVALAAGVLVIALGGFYALRSRPAASAPATSVPAAAAAQPAAMPSPSVAAPAASAPAAAVAPQPAPGAGAPATTPPPASAVAAANSPGAQPAPPAARTAAPPAKSTDSANATPGAVAFDPLALDKNANARLRVDAGRMPPMAELILMMDGKLYMRRSIEEFKDKDDDMYLPPGVHEFRVRARLGPMLKISNIVSTEFEAKKRKTLRIEPRLPAEERDRPLTSTERAAATRIFIELR